MNVKLTEQELSSAIYHAKWQKWQREKQILAKQIHDQNVAYFSQPWTFERLKEFIEWKASEFRFKDGSAFDIDEHNCRVIDALCLYFSNDDRFPEYGKVHFNEQNWSLEKALLLRGPTGRGKSSIMELFTANPKMSYNIIPAQHIRNRVKDIGEKCLGDFLLGRPEPAGNYKCFFQTRIGICVDDFGIEEHVYGVEPLQKYIEMAHSLKQFPWYLRHLTSMLKNDEIENKYGAHVRSRMREMYNDIVLTGPDRRK